MTQAKKKKKNLLYIMRLLNQANQPLVLAHPERRRQSKQNESADKSLHVIDF